MEDEHIKPMFKVCRGCPAFRRMWDNEHGLWRTVYYSCADKDRGLWIVSSEFWEYDAPHGCCRLMELLVMGQLKVKCSTMRRRVTCCQQCNNFWRMELALEARSRMLYGCLQMQEKPCGQRGFERRLVPFGCDRFGAYVAAEANREEAARER